ncbi:MULTISPECIES: hypothetical protein [unclassified Geodermatophilus]
MTAPAPPQYSFTLLDRLITEAWTDLRAARAAAARVGNRENLDLLTRTEEHLNALLEYRHAALLRCPRVGGDLADEATVLGNRRW